MRRHVALGLILFCLSSAALGKESAVNELSSGGDGEIELEKSSKGSAKSAKIEVSEEEAEKLSSELSLIETKISVTKREIGRIRDASYLPDLYFSLGDMHTQKARIQYLLKIAKNPDKNPNDLDFTAEKRPKVDAIEIYQKIYNFFPKEKRRDKALFLTGLEQRDLGQFDAMVKTFAKLSQEFPTSEHFNEANIIVGDYLLEGKKSIEAAIDVFKRVINRPMSAFTPLAHYRTGWCYINLSLFQDAVKSFEMALQTQSQANPLELPEFYRRTDIRREAVLSLSMPYVEVFTDPKMPPTISPVEYFRQKSPDHFTYRRVLSRAGKRLILKERWKDAADAFYHVLELSTDFDTRFEALQKVNESHKRKESRVDFLPFVREIAVTVDLLQASLDHPIDFTADALIKFDKAKAGASKSSRIRTKTAMLPVGAFAQLEFLELLMRDFSTQLHAKAKSSGSPEDFIETAEAYEAYLFRFPRAPKALDIEYNLADAQFKGGRMVRAGVQYESLSRDKRLKPKASYFKELSVESFTRALAKAEELTPVERIRARHGLRTIGTDWLRTNSKAASASTIAFNIANSWYEERNLKKAIESLRGFVKQYPRDPRVRDAIFLTINAYSQLDDYKGLQKSGEQLVVTASLTDADKKTIRDAIRRAQTKQLQTVAGEFGSKEYAENLLSVASKYKGSSLGVQALYEAFSSLKSKKDPELFEVGEALITQHGDSQYSKEVASTMATLALSTASFDRAAKYLSLFADKYPSDKESLDFRKTAAALFERQGDFKKARVQYDLLKDRLAVARMDLQTNDWAALETSSVASGAPQASYWKALAIWRQKRYQDATPLLRALASDPKTPADQAGHAKFLLVQLPLVRYRSIEMKSAEDQAALMNKVKAFQVLSKEVQGIVSTGGRWPIAALYLLGQTHYDLGRFIADSPLPKGLDAANKKVYIGELNKQAASYLSEATKVFAKCVETAQNNDVFTRYVDGCRAKGSKIVREEEDLTRAPASIAGTEPPRAKEIRKKLIDSSKDLELLFGLAESYIRADQPQTANGIYSRLLELDQGNARAIASTGVTALYLNDFDHAFEQFKLALARDPKNAIALYNLAGLYKQFGFSQKLAALKPKLAGISKPGLLHPYAQ